MSTGIVRKLSEKEENYLLKEQVKELYEAINTFIDSCPADVKTIIESAKLTTVVGRYLRNYDYERKLKTLNLTDEFIKELDYRDIQEKINIDKKEVKRKVREFDFTEYEKDILISGFSGCIKSFLDRHQQQFNKKVGV